MKKIKNYIVGALKKRLCYQRLNKKQVEKIVKIIKE